MSQTAPPPPSARPPVASSWAGMVQWPPLGTHSVELASSLDSESSEFRTVHNDRHFVKRQVPRENTVVANNMISVRGRGISAAAKIIGSSKSNYSSMKAAPIKPKKAVFCISNVDMETDEEMLADWTAGPALKALDPIALVLLLLKNCQIS